jgi:hypothetical protein
LRDLPNVYRCAVGKGVATAFQKLEIPFDNWIYQPQARAGASVDLESGWPELLERVGQEYTV